jgi:hypothetical protein
VVLDRVGGQREVGVLERPRTGREFVQDDAGGGCGLADDLGGGAGDLDRAGFDRGAGDVRASEQLDELNGVGAADQHGGAAGAGDDVGDAGVGEDAAAAEHEDVVGGERHLAHEVRRQEDGAALPGELPHQRPDPQDALGSRPLTGSSRSRVCGSPSSAAAMPSR